MPYIPLETPSEFHYIAIYTMGVCHYGHKTPYRTGEVLADSLGQAWAKAYSVLAPSSLTEHIVHVSTAPNPEHMAYQAKIRKEIEERGLE